MKYILLILSLVLSSMLFANWDRACHPNRFFIGAEYQYRRWFFQESSHTDQNMWGGVAGYERLVPCNAYIRLFGRLNSGKTTDGEWCDHEFCGEANVGYAFTFYSHFYVAPYVGAGYFQDREYVYAADGLFYHEREIYFPLGLLLTWDINCQWSIALRGQANVMAWREINSDFGVKMHRKTNWVTELPITYRINPHWDLSLVGEYYFDPNTNITVHTNWGAIVTYGARLEAGYRF